MYIDIHAHILPNVDDGSKSINESLKMLSQLKQQGVKAVALSPHFYPHVETSLEEYKERILPRFRELKEAAAGFFDEIYLGSEVHFFHGISTFSDIRSLCIEKTKYILIELPYRRISSRTINDIIDLNLCRGVMPILAHIERYKKFENFDKILSLIEDGYALGQVNAYSFLSLRTRGAVCRLVKNGYVQFVASDSHSADEIPPLIGKAFEVIEKKLGRETAQTLRENADKLYEEIKERNE